MLLILWALVGVFLGVIWVIVTPWTAARIRGSSWIEWVSDRYVWLAQTAVRRSAIVLRDGDVQLVAKRYDPDHKADKDTASGEPRHHRDSLNVVGRLKGKILAFADTECDTYFSPLVAELAEAGRNAKEDKEIGPRVQSGKRAMLDGIPVSKTSKLVDLSEARYLTTGSAEPETGQQSYEQVKISQEKFHNRLSFGRGVLLILAFGGSLGIAWLGASQAGGSAPSLNETTVSMIPLLAGASRLDVDWKLVAAIGYIAASILAVPLLAAVSYGAVAALLTILVAALIAVLIPASLVLFGPAIPAAVGLPLARGWWILAQLAVGRGVLVERADGAIEHHQLREGDEIGLDERYWTVLDDGSLLPIRGSSGDLFQFAWAPMGATAVKTEENMGPLSETPPASGPQTDGGRVQASNVRQGRQPSLRVGSGDGWIVTLPQLWQFTRRSSESESVRQGRDKGLTEHGGEQQISMLVFLGLLVLCLVLGGLFGLVAGGAVL